MNNISFDDIHLYVKGKDQIKRVNPLLSASSAPTLNKYDLISMVTDESVQVDMDCEAGEDPKNDKKYWQHLAGLRGAQEEYLRYDLREALGENSRLKYTVAGLTAKLQMAEKQIEELKANKCNCQKKKEYVPPVYRGLCL